jgi:hypothetical protein
MDRPNFPVNRDLYTVNVVIRWEKIVFGTAYFYGTRFQKQDPAWGKAGKGPTGAPPRQAPDHQEQG